MGDIERATARLRELLSSQLFCVLATQDRGQPYGNLVAKSALAWQVFSGTLRPM